MPRGVVGAGDLNIELQKALNPVGSLLTRGGYCYQQGDKVTQIRNNYDKNVLTETSGLFEN